MNRIKETVEFIHDGIKVYVKIDYINNKISLVEPINNLLSGKFKYKEYVFVNRGVEYMDGWINVLKAMEFAILEAKRMYEAELEKTSRFKSLDTIIKMVSDEKYLKKEKKFKKLNS